MERYDRQIRLPEIGVTGQRKLQAASVLCVGAGGLGSPALLYLAAAGIGRIGIIDFDCVDESNLQRQILFSMDALGQPKAQAAAQRLRMLNPTIQIDAYTEELNVESATRLFPAYDLILDGSDNFETKFLINDAALKFGKPWIYGAIQGFDGQISVFNDRGSACYRCLYPEKPKSMIMSCAEVGVLGVAVGIIGVTQALQVVQIITGHASFELLSNRLWMIDARTMEARTLKVQKNPSCSACSRPAKAIHLQYTSPICASVPEISLQQMQEKSDCILIDVREVAEWDQGHIANAQLWPLSKLMQGDIPDLPQDCEIILYCQRGRRSLQAAKILQSHGFTAVYSLSGGYDAYL